MASGRGSRPWGGGNIQNQLLARELTGRPVVARPFLADLSSQGPLAGSVSINPGGMMSPPFVVRYNQCGGYNRGKWIAVGDEEGYVSILDGTAPLPAELCPARPDVPRPTAQWLAHHNAIFDLAWCQDDEHMLTGSGDQCVHLWDTSTARGLGQFRGHHGSVKSVCPHPAAPALFATGARDGALMVWDVRCEAAMCPRTQISYQAPVLVVQDAHRDFKGLRGRKRKFGPPDTKHTVTSVVFMQQDHILATSCDRDNVVKFWDIRKVQGPAVSVQTRQQPTAECLGRTQQQNLGKREHGVSCLTLSPQGTRLLVSCSSSCHYLYDAVQPQLGPLATYSGYTSGSFYVRAAFSGDGTHILSGSSDHKPRIWAGTLWGEQVDRPGDPPLALGQGDAGEVTGVAWCPTDLGHITTCHDDAIVNVWTVDLGRSSPRRPVPTRPRGHAWVRNDWDNMPPPTETFERWQAEGDRVRGSDAAQQGDDDVIVILSQPSLGAGGRGGAAQPSGLNKPRSDAAHPAVDSQQQQERSGGGARSRGGTPLEDGCAEALPPSCSGGGAQQVSEQRQLPLLREASLGRAAGPAGTSSCGAAAKGAAAAGQDRRMSLTSLFTPLPGTLSDAPDQATPPPIKAPLHGLDRPGSERHHGSDTAVVAVAVVTDSHVSGSPPGKEALEAPGQASNQENNDPLRDACAGRVALPRVRGGATVGGGFNVRNPTGGVDAPVHPWAGRDPGSGQSAAGRRRRPFAQLPLSPGFAGSAEDTAPAAGGGLQLDLDGSGLEGEGQGLESDPIDFSLLADMDRSRGLGCLSQAAKTGDPCQCGHPHVRCVDGFAVLSQEAQQGPQQPGRVAAAAPQQTPPAGSADDFVSPLKRLGIPARERAPAVVRPGLAPVGNAAWVVSPPEALMHTAQVFCQERLHSTEASHEQQRGSGSKARAEGAERASGDEDADMRDAAAADASHKDSVEEEQQQQQEEGAMEEPDLACGPSGGGGSGGWRSLLGGGDETRHSAAEPRALRKPMEAFLLGQRSSGAQQVPAAAEGTPAARPAGPLPGDGFTDESPAPRQPLTPAPAQEQAKAASMGKHRSCAASGGKQRTILDFFGAQPQGL